jgi:hypothetical protein
MARRNVGSTPHLQYPILEMEYDRDHQAHLLTDADNEKVILPLRPRTHNRQLQWDERYVPHNTACRLPRACLHRQQRSFAPQPHTSHCSYRQVTVPSLLINLVMATLR